MVFILAISVHMYPGYSCPGGNVLNGWCIFNNYTTQQMLTLRDAVNSMISLSNAALGLIDIDC